MGEGHQVGYLFNLKILLPVNTYKIKTITENTNFDQIEKSSNDYDHDTQIFSFLQELISSYKWPSKFAWDITVQQFYIIWFKGLSAIIVSGIFIGITITIETFIKLKRFGIQTELPTILALLIINHLGPLISSYIIAFQSSGGLVADLITGRLNEEWKILRLNGYNPCSVQCWPRIFVLIFILFILTHLFTILLIVSSSLTISYLLLHATILSTFKSMVILLTVENFIILTLKSFFSSLIIACIPIYYGITSKLSHNISDIIKTSMFYTGLGILFSNFAINLLKIFIFK